MTYLSTTHLGTIHLYTCTRYIYKHTYFTQYMLLRGIEFWFPWFHTNVLTIKPPHHFIKQYGTKCI